MVVVVESEADNFLGITQASRRSDTKSVD